RSSNRSKTKPPPESPSAGVYESIFPEWTCTRPCASVPIHNPLLLSFRRASGWTCELLNRSGYVWFTPSLVSVLISRCAAINSFPLASVIIAVAAVVSGLGESLGDPGLQRHNPVEAPTQRLPA